MDSLTSMFLCWVVPESPGWLKFWRTAFGMGYLSSGLWPVWQ